ncbi:hypothetical protein [Agromyces sp. NPDC058126]|uniref:hypothetical protein n=1 Tax=Agromyces sp. NPDC058126 TaxID=3346350 RepID=UPI0036DEC9AD
MPIPRRLQRRAFAVTAAGALGLGASRLRGADIDRPFHGVRSIGIDLRELRGRCRAYLPRMRGPEVFSHSTAALLYEIPLPAELEAAPTLHVSSTDDGRPRAVGVTGHRIKRMLRRDDRGLPLASPADTWCQLATQLSLDDLIAAGDAFVSGRLVARGFRVAPLCTRDELRAAIGRHRPARGTAKLGEALEHVRTGVDSRRETHTRLTIVRSGLPEPVIAAPVVVLGGVVLHPDLSYPELKIAIEYEGEEHRLDAARWRDDIARRRALESAGWIVIRVTIADLRAPGGFLADIRAHRRRRLAH